MILAFMVFIALGLGLFALLGVVMLATAIVAGGR